MDKLKVIEDDQKIIKDIVTELKMAICGSEKIGVKGLIKTVSEHDAYIESDKKRKWMMAGAITVLASSASLFWSKIFN